MRDMDSLPFPASHLWLFYSPLHSLCFKEKMWALWNSKTFANLLYTKQQMILRKNVKIFQCSMIRFESLSLPLIWRPNDNNSANHNRSKYIQISIGLINNGRVVLCLHSRTPTQRLKPGYILSCNFQVPSLTAPMHVVSASDSELLIGEYIRLVAWLQLFIFQNK